MDEMFEELGFRKFEHPLSSKPAYAYRLGPYEIEAVVWVNRWSREGYFLGGIVNTGRTISSVEGELPLEVDSKEQALALLSYFLARHIPERDKPPWLRIGERMTAHLPWMTHSGSQNS